jgi:hypothetical protein
MVAAWNAAAIARSRTGARVRKKPTVWYKTTAARYVGIALASIVAVSATVYVAAPFIFPKQQTLTCTLKPMRDDQFNALVAGDAVIVFERNGGTSCIDELFAVYPDGRVESDYGDGNVKTTEITTERLDEIMVAIDDYGWFGDEFVTTHHTPCAACYQYNLTVKYEGQEKTVGAVDGGADAPDKYFQIVGKLAGILPMGA